MSLDRFHTAVAPARAALADHPMYRSLVGLDDLRTFMAHHVFAVWDFMSLLKQLQREVTCITVPWTPPHYPADVVRFINEIVVGEESDRIDGRVVSHVQLYLEAMAEVGADRGAFLVFCGYVDAGATPTAVFDRAAVPTGAQAFVRATFGVIASGSLAAVAGAFCAGREQVIPEMFDQVLADLGPTAPTLRLYLARHVELDGDEHGGLAEQLLSAVCGADPQAWAEATAGALIALDARARLWSSVHAAQVPSWGLLPGRG